ncbi:TetR family transcriptional regulator [Saccharopolyspora sp. NFXS83]|uniref:TetR family transcriptional regulator n=1 Tax=Saccharopolyspora sp. NFXS83 TaxID=2993560 RepID=UPI002B057721|nr:TetR family transcriptional regulator [Saccharopolyspora sp. NFXS83]
MYAVSNRQIGEAAGQGNNFAVGYHFGGKEELVRMIMRRHAERVEHVRIRMVAELSQSTEVHDWVACLIRPDAVSGGPGHPSWYARFGAQVMADPGLRRIAIHDSLTTVPLQQVLDGLNRCLPSLPRSVHLERSAMARNLMSYTFAERERALAENTTTPRSTWEDTLIDAIVACGRPRSPLPELTPPTSTDGRRLGARIWR